MRLPLVTWSALLTTVASTPWVAQISPLQGGYRGGTELTITGDSFSQNQFTMAENEDPNFGNWVYIQVRDNSFTFNCPIILKASAPPKQLVCLTPNFDKLYKKPLNDYARPAINSPFYNMKVFVVSDGVISNEKTFTTHGGGHWGKTPEMWGFHSSGGHYGYPDRDVDINGRFYTRAFNGTEQNFDNGHTCQNDCRVQKFRHKTVDLNSYLHDAEPEQTEVCDLFKADPFHYALENDGYDKNNGKANCKLGGNIIGNQEVEFMVTKDYGTSNPSGNRLVGNQDGLPYIMQSYAKVDGLLHSSSGTNGGGILTIQGDYFLTKSKNVKITVAGQDCPVVDLSMTKIKCKLPAGAETTVAPEVYYPGNRGMRFVSYRSWDNATYEELEALNFEAIPDDPSTHDDWSHVEQGIHQYNYVNSGIRPGGANTRGGWSGLGVFYFNPKRDTRFDLVYSGLRKWNRQDLEYDAMFDLDQNTWGPIDAKEKFDGQTPSLKKIKFNEIGDNHETFPTWNWQMYWMVKDYDPVLSNYRQHDVTYDQTSEFTRHNYKFHGAFLSEKQKFVFNGDKSLMTDIGLQVGSNQIPGALSFDDDMLSIKTNVEGILGNTCPASFKGDHEEPAVWFNGFENDADCNPNLSDWGPFCGEKAVRIKTNKDEKVWHAFWEADDGQGNGTFINGGCDGQKFQPLDINPANDDDKIYLCMAHRGNLAQMRSDNSYVRADVTYFNATHHFKTWEKMHFWGQAMDISIDNLYDWKFRCSSLKTNFNYNNNWANGKDNWFDDYADFGTEYGAYGHRMTKMYVVGEDSDGYFEIDHVGIYKDYAEARRDTEMHMAAIVKSEMPTLKGMNVASLDGSQTEYELELEPSACATGHPELAFYDTTGSDPLLSETTNGITKYSRASWPADTFISVQRTQASKSSMLGSATLNYGQPQFSQAVKIPLATDKISDIVNAYALAGARTEVEFYEERTCETLAFTVKITEPGGAIDLPTSVDKPNSNLNYEEELLEDGFEQYRIDMDWFLTAHKKPQVQVEIDNVMSFCHTFGACDFEYKADLNPEITSIDYSDDVTGTTITPGVTEFTVTGKNIDNLTIENPPCELVSSSSNLVGDENIQTVVLRVKSGLKKGSYNFIAFDEVNGTPEDAKNAGSGLIFEVDYSVNSVTPTDVNAGGGLITIVGVSLDCNMEIYVCQSDAQCSGVDKYPCQIQENPTCSDTEITALCKFPASGNDKKLFIDGTDSGQLLNFIPAPEISYIEDADGNQVQGPYVTKVNGEEKLKLIARAVAGGFGDDKFKITVYLGNNKEHKLYVKGEMTSLQGEITLPVLAPGSYPITIWREDVGYFVCNHQIYVPLSVDAIDINSGSIYGGNTAVLTGMGFDSETEVKVGDKVVPEADILVNQAGTQITFKVPNSMRIIQENISLGAKDNQISWNENIEIKKGESVQWIWDLTTQMFDLEMLLCQADFSGEVGCSNDPNSFSSGRASRGKQGQFQQRFTEVGTYYITSGCLNERCTMSLVGKVVVIDQETSTSADIVVSIAGHEMTSAPLQWHYEASKSAVVKGISVGSSGISIAEPIVIKGTGFLSAIPSNDRKRRRRRRSVEDDANNSWTITVGGYPCVVNSITDDEIQCLVDESAEPSLFENLQVSISNENGEAGFLTDRSGEFLALLPTIYSISGNSGSLNGGKILTLSGSGLDTEGTQVLFDNFDVCEILTSSYTQLTCRAPKFNTGANTQPDSERTISVSGVNTGNYNFEVTPEESKFSYLQSETPVITQIAVQGGLTFNSDGSNSHQEGTVQDIKAGSIISWTVENDSGSGFTVLLNNIECMKDSATASVCTLNDNLPSGNIEVVFRDNSFGNAYLAPELGLALNAPSELTNLAPTSGSLAGGNIIDISGSGFNDLSTVTFEVNNQIKNCEVVSFTASTLRCTVPDSGADDDGVTTLDATVKVEPDFTGSLTYTFDNARTQRVSKFLPELVFSGQTLTIQGSNLNLEPDVTISIKNENCPIISSTNTEITCTLPALSAGLVETSDIVVFSPTLGTVIYGDKINQILYGIEISSISPTMVSPAGGVEVTITGQGFENQMTFQLCNRADDVCQDISFTLDSQTQIRFEAPATPNREDGRYEIRLLPYDYDSENTLYLSAIGEYFPLEFDSSIMPVITGVTPSRGGTGGGTVITVTGENFDLLEGTPYIGEIECDNFQLNSATEFSCMTKTLPLGYSQRGLITFKDTSNTVANDDVIFWYIDRWNSRYTWGGEDPPREGEMAVISEGQTILIDGQTNVLKMLLINGGHIIFDDSQDCHLRAENILITNGGSLTAGTEETPYEGNLKIEMFGKSGDLELPVYGAKTMAVRDGLISLHGKKKVPTWTTVEEDANIGDTSITVNHEVNWEVGDRIVISSTGDRASFATENEERVITSIDGSTIHFTPALDYKHYGSWETLPNGAQLDMRAEVGVLDRNIIFTGDDHTELDDFGACMMASPSEPGTYEGQSSQGNMKLSNIHITRAGQIFRLARYPVHFHFLGVNSESFIHDSVVHASRNRAIVVHHTDHLVVNNNFVHDVKGGAIFIEDGIERFNEVTNNLVVKNLASSSLQLDDLTPAAIWITNPNNKCSFNRVAGCEHFGIWYRMFEHPEMGSFTKEVCQQHEPMGECDGNVVHSIGGIALWFFESYFPYEGSGHGLSCMTEVPKPGVIKNFHAYRNQKGIEFFDIGAMRLENCVLAESSDSAVEWKRLYDVSWDSETIGAYMVNTTIAARTSRYDDVVGMVQERAGLIIPAQSGLLVDGIDFIGFGNEMTWSGPSEKDNKLFVPHATPNKYWIRVFLYIFNFSIRFSNYLPSSKYPHHQHHTTRIQEHSTP